MFSDNVAESARRISNARPKGRWFILARELQRLEATAPEAPNGQPWPDALFDALRREIPSLSRSYFQKMRAADAFLADLAERRGQQFAPTNFEGRSLTAIDIARRLSELDEHAAVELADRIRDDLAGVAEAEAALRDAKQARSTASVPARQRAWGLSQEAEQILEKELIQSPQNFFGEMKSGDARWRPRTARFGVGCDVMVQIGSGPHQGSYVGFEILVLSDGRERLGWHRRLGQIALSASFFANYWIVLVTGQAETLVNDIKALCLDNVGLAVVGSAEQIIRIHHPGSTVPVPDRRSMIGDAIAF